MRQLDVDEWDDGVDFEDDMWRTFASWSRVVEAPTNSITSSVGPSSARIDAIRPLLPNGLIGEHARQHLEHDHRFREAAPRRRSRASRFLNRGETAELLRAIIENGDVREFHRCLKTAERHGEPCSDDRVAGIHDVLRFLEAIGNHRVTRNVVDEFFRVFKRTSSVESASRITSRTHEFTKR